MIEWVEMPPEMKDKINKTEMESYFVLLESYLPTWEKKNSFILELYLPLREKKNSFTFQKKKTNKHRHSSCIKEME